jgi:hypothetical protein
LRIAGHRILPTVNGRNSAYITGVFHSVSDEPDMKNAAKFRYPS